MSKRALVPAASPGPDLVRDGLHNLQQRMVQAVIERRDLSDLELQRDTVEGARRLETALGQLVPATAATVAAWEDARAYRLAAEAVLARLEGPRVLGRGR